MFRTLRLVPLHWLVGGVWLLNGLVCKVLNLVPRHQEIVGTVFGAEWAREITLAIGLGEVGLAVLVFAGWRPFLLAAVQTLLVLAMNVIELLTAADLLLWGPMNFLFAALFCGLVWVSARCQLKGGAR